MMKQLNLKEFLESRMGDITPPEGSKTAIEQAEINVPKNLMFDAESGEFKPETKPVTSVRAKGMTLEEAKDFDDEIGQFVESVLIAGTDYGIIPRCSKPSLLKPGAEKIMNYLGLIARTEITNRAEDYSSGFFSYECKVYLIDYNGVVRGEGIATSNTKEARYLKGSGYNYQNVVAKMAKKRALVDAVLNVGNLSGKFTQDIEDMQTENDKQATQKQIQLLETLMNKYNTSMDAINGYVRKNWNIDNYKKISYGQCSQLIDKYKALG